MDALESDFKELEKDLGKFQANHKDYVKKLEEVEQLKKKYADQFQKYKKKLLGLEKSITDLEKNNKDASGIRFETIKDKVAKNINYIHQIEDTLPRQNGLYLKIIIGSVCVSILNKAEKWKYKEEYEKFKFVVTLISLFFSFLLLFIRGYRVLDALLNFLLVWYYCTLTIREAILVVNGSKINTWWQAHHFVSTVCTAVLLIWPDSKSYQSFRMNQICFSFYISFVQLLQYYYQKGCLYRLRALGEKDDMDTTVEGYASWMSRGLSYILPFLFIGYMWQLYSSYLLFNISLSDECHEWQVFLLSIIFFVLFIGNISTLLFTIRKKFKDRVTGVKNLFWEGRYKYTEPSEWKTTDATTSTSSTQCPSSANLVELANKEKSS